jgi:hypothetical protein
MQTLKFPKRDGELAPEAKGSYVSLMDWVPICAPRHGLRLVAVLAAYFDASNTEHALGVTSIVGYVAPLEKPGAWLMLAAFTLRNLNRPGFCRHPEASN